MEWLNGPGKVFRDPLPGSTNYMCAYDTSGRLIRAKDESQFAARVVVPEEQEKEIQEKEIEDGLNAEQREERFVARQEARSRQADIDPRSSLPRERFGDLRPYPMNISFRSERVLSEELREELYTQVVERGMDVSTVSAAFGVDIRRVAAVVRLKTIEKRWIEKVSFYRVLSSPFPFMMISIQSISLQDNYMVTQLALRASLTTETGP